MSYRRSTVKSVQTGSIVLHSATSNTFALGTAVDKNYSAIILTAVTTDSGSGAADINACRVELTDGATVTAFVNTADLSTRIVYFTVIQFFPFVLLQAVQHLSFTGPTQSITAVGAKASWFPGGCTTTDTGGTAKGMVGGGELTSTTVVTKRDSPSRVAGCVVDFK